MKELAKGLREVLSAQRGGLLDELCVLTRAVVESDHLFDAHPEVDDLVEKMDALFRAYVRITSSSNPGYEFEDLPRSEKAALASADRYIGIIRGVRGLQK